SPLMPSPRPDVGKSSPKPEFLHEKTKLVETASLQTPKNLNELKSSKASTPQPPPQKLPQPQLSRPHSQPQSTTVPSSPLSIALSSLNNSLPPQMLQYHCDQCKIMPTPTNSGLAVNSNSVKRKLDEKEDGSHEKDGINSAEDQHRDKRLRTTITPEQLEILYDKYLLDSNPTRKMLDHIAREVGLKKRVVQVCSWALSDSQEVS
uniref:Homeobox domain-containing protein n=1 Tax=Cyprinus carpio TaxID=7962 RepID=A0A8C2HLF1_CYPCA